MKPETLRPFRLFDSKEQKFLMGRWYRWLDKAHDAAVVICRREMKIGRTLEVLDLRHSNRLVATYTKRVMGIEIKTKRILQQESKRRKPVKLRLVA